MGLRAMEPEDIPQVVVDMYVIAAGKDRKEHGTGMYPTEHAIRAGLSAALKELERLDG